MDEIKAQFGVSTSRRHELFERLKMFFELAKHCGALRMFVNGSFITSKPEPGDVDVVIWLDEKYIELLKLASSEALRMEEVLDTREPQEVFAVYEELDWKAWLDFFSVIRQHSDKRKGLVEVLLA
jgi:hypothetical protein